MEKQSFSEKLEPPKKLRCHISDLQACNLQEYFITECHSSSLCL